MKRFFLLFTAILATIVAIGGYWYATVKDDHIKDHRWLSRSFEAVESLHIHGSKGTYMLRSNGGEWIAQVPGASWNIEARGVPSKVAAYLSLVADLAPHRSIGGFDRGGPEEFGLEQPEYKLIISFKGNSEALTVKLASDGGGTVFGWNSDSPGLVYEFSSDIMKTLDQPATHFLDKRVFSFDEEAVQKVQLVQPFGSSWLVEKKSNGFFFSLPGYLKGKPASDSNLKLYLHSLALLNAGSLVLEPVVADKRIPALTVRVWSGRDQKESSVDFYTVKDDPSVYMGKSTWLTVPFLLDAQSVSQLVRSAFDVQGRSVLKLDIGKVARLVVVHGGNEYVVVRSETGWRLFDGTKDIPGIDMSLWRFTELQFEALPLNNLPDSAVELMFCKLVGEDDDVLTSLTFYVDPKLPQGQCWMKNGGGMYYPVSSRLLKDLQGMFPAGAVEPLKDTPLQ